MGRISLLFKAELDNVRAVKMPLGVEWAFKIKCTNCQHVKDSFICLNLTEKIEL